MRIVVDLDGVICKLKNPDQSYFDVEPNIDVIELLKEWKRHGHTVIIYTGRHMRTCNGNVTKVIKKIGKMTQDWLKKWNVPYDEFYYGKPYADIYIDDLALTFSSAKDIKSRFDSLKLNFVIPMAGEGKRFRNAGFKNPKYMIKVNDKSLFEWAIESLPLSLSKQIIFVCLREHERERQVSKFIRKIMGVKYPKIDYKIRFIPKVTRGQVETVLACKKYINNNQTLVIYNIDTSFKSSRLKTKLLTVRNQNVDGILGGYNSDDPKLSFIKLDSKGFVKRTKEKQVISNIASTGLYIFTKGSDFVEAAEYMIKNSIKSNNEFFVSELYNVLIRDGKKFIVDMAEEFIPLGTPEDLKNFSSPKK
jgi:capsule biosynthesis phosphatase